MKTLMTILTIAAALSVPGQAVPPQVMPEIQDAQAQADASAPKAKTAADAQLDKVQQQLSAAQNQLDAQLAQAEAQVKQAEEQAAAAADEENSAVLGDLPALPGVGRFGTMAHGGRGAGKSLVIRSTDSDPKEQANLEEDLSVMAHILDKAVEEKLGDQARRHQAMGINVVFGSSSAPFRSLYLDGYGALFLLHVSFPLVAAPKPEVREPNTQTSSTWEEARQELYGEPGQPRVVTRPAEQYDEEKVNQLKDSVLDALKNASNIRDLKADDSITVCIFGAAGSSAKIRSTVKRAGAGAGVSKQIWVASDGKRGRTRGTIMTIRVRKSDADAFAKGKSTLDDFRKKARIAAYVGNSDTGASAFGFGGNGFDYEFSSGPDRN
jgi:hypothetical protein